MAPFPYDQASVEIKTSKPRGKELILFHWEMIMKLLCEIYIFNEVNIYGIKYFKGIINSEYLV